MQHRYYIGNGVIYENVTSKRPGQRREIGCGVVERCGGGMINHKKPKINCAHKSKAGACCNDAVKSPRNTVFPNKEECERCLEYRDKSTRLVYSKSYK